MQRENRYIVLKLSDVKGLPEHLGLALDKVLDAVQFKRSFEEKPPLQCVVVESDWPEYEPTWQAIEQRIDAVPMKVASEDIEQVLTSIASRFDEELLSTPESELEKNWHFKWDETTSIEWNTYKFSDMLEMFKRSCRRWEEHHNGSGCVVERVREKYLMPKIRGFLAELQAHNGKGLENAD